MRSEVVVVVPDEALLHWWCPVPKPDKDTLVASYAIALACLKKAEDRFVLIKKDITQKKAKEQESGI